MTLFLVLIVAAIGEAARRRAIPQRVATRGAPPVLNTDPMGPPPRPLPPAPPPPRGAGAAAIAFGLLGVMALFSARMDAPPRETRAPAPPPPLPDPEPPWQGAIAERGLAPAPPIAPPAIPPALPAPAPAPVPAPVPEPAPLLLEEGRPEEDLVEEYA